MKAIKNISIAPDLEGSLCTIFFEDNSKLSVTVRLEPGALMSPDFILTAVEKSLGLSYGTLAGSKVDDFVTAFDNAYYGTTRFTVRADHPTLARPDKSNLTASEARQYAAELSFTGFENIQTITDIAAASEIAKG